MKKLIQRTTLKMSAAFVAGYMLSASSANAANFSTISANMSTSVATLPSLLAGLSYLAGILLGVLGVLKIKDHVENPSNTPLKDGAIRLAAGGGLFALPILYDAMHNTIGTGGGVSQSSLASITP